MMCVRLTSTDPFGRRIELPLREGGNLIGRTPECDINIEDRECSRRQARITILNDGAWICDLGSGNATFVNNEAIGKEDVPLEDGDELIFGVTSFTIQYIFDVDEDSGTMVNVMQARRQATSEPIETTSRNKVSEEGQTRIINRSELLEKVNRKIEGFARYPFLEVMGHGGGSRRYLLKTPTLTIGRASTNHLVLEDKHVSGKHAVIRKTSKGFVVEDCDSRNGVFINNTKVSRHLLRPNRDTIQLGDTRLRFFMPRD
jgi:pSer/pThr/pTyr-binding forkhead associated (FHA) protein